MTESMLKPISFDGIKDKKGVRKAILEACSQEQMAKIRAMDSKIRSVPSPLSKPTPELLARIEAMAKNAH
ncbi:hypothetical protein NHP190002_06490 [Helicobacter ailurogastricus]|uniref:hypothetical protein n=1 Tax=Helicobacter ailurogastricus TaxID=1578720 RepID=UPI00244D852E|nr:hypothetical protein [Helicobacter ailurogastricus]GMB89968.1 hypothetical protein NHP190002_06490 [Helicobacter ailurogastricus]